MENEKRPYVPPEMVKLGGVRSGEGAPMCMPGSGNYTGGGDCASGSAAANVCASTGSAPMFGCTIGSAADT